MADRPLGCQWGLRTDAKGGTVSAPPVEADPHPHCPHDRSRRGHCRASGRVCSGRARSLAIDDGEEATMVSEAEDNATAGRNWATASILLAGPAGEALIAVG